MKTLKERVLERCGEIAPNVGKNDTQFGQMHRSMGDFVFYNHTKTVKILVGDEIDENDLVWPIAAQVLGIAEKPRQLEAINTVLTYELGHKMLRSEIEHLAARVESSISEPTDQLEEDRETIRKAFENDLAHDLKRAGFTIVEINAIKRLAGLEVQNG